MSGKKASIFTLAGSLCLITSAAATTTLIDFGRADNSTGSNYNNALFAAVALNDTTGAATGWTINVTEDGTGQGGGAGGGALALNFGSITEIPQAVPEPSSSLLILLSGIGLTLRRRR